MNISHATRLKARDTLPGSSCAAIMTVHGGDPRTYRRDAAMLEAALQTETKPFLQARYRFYLAQSYRDCGEPEKALENYLVRAGLGFWQEEVFLSLYYAGSLREQLNYPDEEVIGTYLRAADAMPSRAEALHGASRFCRLKGRNEEGCRIALRGLEISLPPDGLFLEPWIYETGLLDEYSVNAYWAGHYRKSLDACLQLLAKGGEVEIARIAANARFSFEKLQPADAIISGTNSWPAGLQVPDVPFPAPAPMPARNIGGMVSIITPTHNRNKFLRQALKHFRN